MIETIEQYEASLTVIRMIGTPKNDDQRIIVAVLAEETEKYEDKYFPTIDEEVE